MLELELIPLGHNANEDAWLTQSSLWWLPASSFPAVISCYSVYCKQVLFFFAVSTFTCLLLTRIPELSFFNGLYLLPGLLFRHSNCPTQMWQVGTASGWDCVLVTRHVIFFEHFLDFWHNKIMQAHLATTLTPLCRSFFQQEIYWRWIFEHYMCSLLLKRLCSLLLGNNLWGAEPFWQTELGITFEWYTHTYFRHRESTPVPTILVHSYRVLFCLPQWEPWLSTL